jgi:hypothetical protein
MKQLELLVANNSVLVGIRGILRIFSNLRSKAHERTLSHRKLNKPAFFLAQDDKASLAVWPDGSSTLTLRQRRMCLNGTSHVNTDTLRVRAPQSEYGTSLCMLVWAKQPSK